MILWRDFFMQGLWRCCSHTRPSVWGGTGGCSRCYYLCCTEKKIKSKSTLAESCPCRCELLAHWFSGKPTERGAWVLTKEDFPVEYFPAGWDMVLDVHGQGPKVMYPVFLRSTVHRSTRRFLRSQTGDVMMAQQAVYPHASIKFITEQAKN